ncbi:MAG: aldehyde dehydrogenase family protein [Desulfobaccales bacterium]
MSFEERLARVVDLSQALLAHKVRLQELAARELNFTYKDTAFEVDITAVNLQRFAAVADSLRQRQPLAGPGQRWAVMLSYNGSAWVNVVIASAYLVGNRVLVKFASRGRGLMRQTQEIYRPRFGDQVDFFFGSGRDFVARCLEDSEIAGLVFFGFDQNLLPYEEAFRQSGKKVIFEGPGSDPFIVFAEADLEFALTELLNAKFSYSGQTCTAPKRIFIQRPIYEEFLDRLVGRVQALKVGPADDPRSEVSPLGSELAVTRIREQLADAAARGGRILWGGRLEGLLVYPTVIRDATDDMLGFREECFGPVIFAAPFADETEVMARARRHKYGLRAALFGKEAAHRVAAALKGEDYCHPVPDYTFGKFGTVGVNEPRAESWEGAFITKPVGGYGYSGWIWETVEGRFRLKQGPKLITLETSLPG